MSTFELVFYLGLKLGVWENYFESLAKNKAVGREGGCYRGPILCATSLFQSLTPTSYSPGCESE